MKNELGLSRQQYEQILPRVEEREKDRHAAFRERRALAGRLHDLVSNESVPDAAFLEVVDRLLALDLAERDREQTFTADIRAMLSPRQQAQFVLFGQRFRRWLEQRMRDARALREADSEGPGFVPGRKRQGLE